MTKPVAIIVDMDGTLCDASHRVHLVNGSQKKDWKKFNHLSALDKPNEWCRDLVINYESAGFEILILTARMADPDTKQVTEDWLRANLPVRYQLFMRKDKDFRPDYEVKQDIYTLQIAPYWDVQFALDDKLAVVNMWRSVGLTALHCAD